MVQALVRKLSGNRTKIFLRSRKAGKFSPKSLMLYAQASPVFSQKTAQQEAIANAGKSCGAAIRGKYTGPGQVKARRAAMAACIRRAFGKASAVV